MKRYTQVALAAALMSSTPIASASVLTFDGLGTNTSIPAGYGSRVAADGPAVEEGNGFTPNVIVTFSPNGDDGFQTYNDSEWRAAQLDGAPAASGAFDITFTPDPGYAVRVNSFEFDDYANYAAGHTFDWELRAGSTVLRSATGVNVPADTTEDPTGADNLLINIGMASPFEGPLTLRIIPTAGDAYDRAIDDVNFDQVLVPEPGTAALLVTACAIAGRRRMRG
jgi:hypothetical protein